MAVEVCRVADEEILIRVLRKLRWHIVARVQKLRGQAKARRVRRLDAVSDPMLASGVEICRDGGILIDKQWSPAGVTAQFTGDAETYQRRYFERLDFVDLIDRCLTLAAVDREREMHVLDIGSGGGSSAFATCRLLPRAQIVASDISPQLLGMLAAFVESREELARHASRPSASTCTAASSDPKPLTS